MSCNSTRKLHGEPVGCQARRRSGQGPQNNPEAIPVTTGSRDLDEAGDALKSMLGDEPTSPVLRCGSWPKGKANVAKTAIT